MSLAGKYQQVSQENFEPFMKALGFTDEVIQQLKSLPSTSEIEQNGNDFKVTITTGPSVLENKFTIGKETEMQSATGEKIKTVVRLENNKMIVPLKEILSVTELVDPNTLVSTMTLGNIVYKTISKRV